MGGEEDFKRIPSVIYQRLEAVPGGIAFLCAFLKADPLGR
jgi:hypothetical protein